MRSKLFLFRDRLLIARTGGRDSASSDAFVMLLCWSLEELQFETKPLGAKSGDGEASSIAEVRLVFKRGEETIECGCFKAEAHKASTEIRSLQHELRRLKLRRDRSKLLRDADNENQAASVA